MLLNEVQQYQYQHLQDRSRSPAGSARESLVDLVGLGAPHATRDINLATPPIASIHLNKTASPSVERLTAWVGQCQFILTVLVFLITVTILLRLAKDAMYSVEPCSKTKCIHNTR